MSPYAVFLCFFIAHAINMLSKMALHQDGYHYDNEIKLWHCPDDVVLTRCQGNSNFSADVFCPGMAKEQRITYWLISKRWSNIELILEIG